MPTIANFFPSRWVKCLIRFGANKDKRRALYLKALEYYRDQTNGDTQKMLNEIQSVRDGFAKLLYGLAAETREQHERACLLLSANLQRDPKDAVVRDFLRDNQARVEEILVQALLRAQKQGELSQKGEPAALARFFVVTIQGMRAMAPKAARPLSV
jgi:TetR/AcrR family transcriptional repressor of nem operon